MSLNYFFVIINVNPVTTSDTEGYAPDLNPLQLFGTLRDSLINNIILDSNPY